MNQFYLQAPRFAQNTHLYSSGTFRPLFPALPPFTCLAALLHILATHWDLKYPAGLTEQLLLATKGHCGTCWAKQPLCFLSHSFLWWWTWTQKVQTEKEGNSTIKPREVAGEEGRGFRFTQRYIYSSSTHDDTVAEVLAACPESYPKSSWEHVQTEVKVCGYMYLLYKSAH